MIETKHREGYRFKLPVRRIYDGEPEELRTISNAPEASSRETIADTFGRWLFTRRGGVILLPIAVLVVVTVAASIVYRKCPTLAQPSRASGSA